MEYLKIVLLQSVVPKYREDLFSEVAAQAKKDGNQFEIWASKPSKDFEKRGTTSSQNIFREIQIAQNSNIGLSWQYLPWKDLIKADVVIVSDNLRCLSNIFAIALRKFLKRPIGTWGHGVNYQANSTSRLLQSLRLSIINSADATLVYTKKSYVDLIKSGFNHDKISISENTTDHQSSQDLHAEHSEVLAFRARHCLDKNPCVIFLGSWHKNKNPQTIIDYGNALFAKDPGIKVIVIGGGDVEAFRNKYPWLIYLGPLFGREKYIALFAARCLVISGMAGLNIVDAIHAKLPIIATKIKGHSPEIDYLKNNKNGYLITNNLEELVNSSIYLCRNPSIQIMMALENESLISRLTVPEVANNIYQFSLSLLKSSVIESASDLKRIAVIIFQNMYAYHHARYAAIKAEFNKLNIKLIGIEISGRNKSYGNMLNADADADAEIITLYEDQDYLSLNNKSVVKAVYRTLSSLKPALIFTPAPAFSEGAAAFKYKASHPSKIVMMDDAWAKTTFDTILKKKIKQLIYSVIDGIFVPSRLHGSFFCHYYKIPTQKIKYYYDVVARSKISDTTNNIEIEELCNSEYQKILFVGRLIKRKNADILIRAFALLPKNSARLVIVGDGPELSRLKKLAAHLDVSEKIDWYGGVKNSIVRKLLSIASVVVIPSQLEQWGLIVNESWEANTLVIGTSNVGALQANRNPETDWLIVPENDQKALMSTLNKVLNLSEQERLLLLTVNKQLKSEYSIKNHAKSAVEFFNQETQPKISFLASLLIRLWNGKVVTW